MTKNTFEIFHTFLSQGWPWSLPWARAAHFQDHYPRDKDHQTWCFFPQPFLRACTNVYIHIYIYIFFFCFLGPYLRHMEVPRLGVQSELQPPAYTTATATQDLSHVCDLHHSSRQCWILNPLNEARDWTSSSWILVWFVTCWATMGTPGTVFLKGSTGVLVVVQWLTNPTRNHEVAGSVPALAQWVNDPALLWAVV